MSPENKKPDSFADQARVWTAGAWAWTRRQRRAWIALAWIAAGLFAFGVGSVTAAWARACAGGCPGADQIAEYEPPQASEIYDANGDLLGTFARERRRLVSLEDLPPHVPLAFVAIEDQRYFRHEGVDVRRLTGALRDNLMGGFGATGGSTITMQLARGLFPEQLPRGETTFRRKVAEIRVAREMEANFSKAHILELYLNTINLGAGAYGIEAAARTYFDKPAAELDYLEAAVIAGLPQAPSRYNPRRNPELAEARRNRVLRFMAQTGVITQEEYAEGIATPIALGPPRGAIRAPYFVEHVRRELEERLGETLYTAGLRIYTALDPDIQEVAEAAIEDQLARIESGALGPFRHTTYASHIETLKEEEGDVVREGGPTPYLQGIATIMDPHTGHIVAMVGGRDFWHSQFNRAEQAHRQPGSAFKPFVFAAAIEEGRSPLYRVSDDRVHMRLPEGRTWSPRNYDGTYGGYRTLREGMRLSRNMVAIRLGNEVGIDAVQNVAQRAGIRSPIPTFPSIFIGAADVYPNELIAAYAPFANGGTRVEPRFIVRVEDHEGQLLWEPPTQNLPALDPGVAWLTTELMREVVDRGTAYVIRNPAEGNLSFDIPAAGKTGTTNNAADVWFVGFTPDLVAGVWFGMDRPQPIMGRATGGRLAAPVWARIMRSIYEGREAPQPWSRPQNVVERTVDNRTGNVVAPDCPYVGEVHVDYFLADAVPAPTCEPPQRFEPGEDPTPHLPGRPVFPGDRGQPPSFDGDARR